MKAKSRLELTEEQKRIVAEAQAEWAEEDRLKREGKLKPWPKHLQDKMDSSGPFAEDIHDAPAPAATQAKPASAAE